VPPPAFPRSERPWTDQEIRAEAGKARLGRQRLDRLRSFAGFVTAESHQLARFGGRLPGFCLQQAYNHAPAAPVGEAAAQALRGAGLPPMLLKEDYHNTHNCPRSALVRTLAGHSCGVRCVAVTPDGKLAVSGSGLLPVSSGTPDNSVRVWDLASGRCLRTLTGHSAPVQGVALTADGRVAVSGGDDNAVLVWDLAGGRCLRRLDGHANWVRCVALTPDGRAAVAGGGMRLAGHDNLRVWDLEAGRCVRALEGHRDSVGAVAVTPDGRGAVSGSLDRTVRVWDLATGECHRLLGEHAETVAGVAVTPDGRAAVSAGFDRTVRVWDLAGGQCLRTLEGHAGRVQGVSLTPDGRTAVSGGDDKTLRAWDLATGRCLAVLPAPTGVSSVSEVRSGGKLALGTWGGQVVFVTLRDGAPDTPLVTAARLWLSGAGRWDDQPTAPCERCGRRFAPPPAVLDAARGLARGLGPDSPPCLALPAAAWDEPRLRADCPHCGQPLRFNPFLVDNRDAPAARKPARPVTAAPTFRPASPEREPPRPPPAPPATEAPAPEPVNPQAVFGLTLAEVQPVLREAEAARLKKLLEAPNPDRRLLENARGVCLMRLGRVEEALHLFRGLVCYNGTLIRPTAPPAFKANLAAARLLAQNVEGAVDLLSQLVAQNETNETVFGLCSCVARWKEGRTWADRLRQWWSGTTKPIQLDFPPGEIVMR
jgi:WD40 repeat protein